MNSYETLSIITQFFIFVATGVYAWFAYGQWKVIRDTLEVTQKQRRPWIMVTPDNPEGWPSAGVSLFSFEFPWSAHNVGESTAFLTRLSVDVIVSIYPVPDNRPDYPINEVFADFIIPPNGKHGHRTLKQFNESDILSIQAGERCFLFYGLVDYRDTFKATHRTRFCSYWVMEAGEVTFTPVGPQAILNIHRAASN